MAELNQRFLCCTRKKIAILRCPQCKQLLGYCRSCSSLFHKLQDLSSFLAVNPEESLLCASCQFAFPGADKWEKYLAVRRDLAEAGLSAIAAEELELSAVSRKEDPLDQYKNSLNRIGWGPGSSGTDVTADAVDAMDKAAKGRLLKLFIIMLLLLAGVAGYYWYFGIPL
jgi:hypothetical protein